jgi:DNA modification methylase
MSISITKKSKFKKQCLEKTGTHRKSNAAKVEVSAASALPSAQNDLSPDLQLVWHNVDELKPSARRIRKVVAEHKAAIIRQIKSFGLVSPITVRGTAIVDGYTRWLAAKELGFKQVPCIDVSHLSEAKSRMLGLSLNRLAETGEWDMTELKLELEELQLDGFDLTLSGFTLPELDIIMLDDVESGAQEEEPDEPPALPVSRAGDLWLLGERHKILCGDALDAKSYELLLAGEAVTAVLTDTPYNVKIAGNVSGLGKTKHGEFKMASGEMSAAEFSTFLTSVHKLCADRLITGAVVYSFIDWRSVETMIAAGRAAGLTLINLAVWNKGSGAMGGFLRSAHELVPIFCKGEKAAINNVALGTHGRDRTNVWSYPGANQPGSSAADALEGHPTPKNVEMCIDAILDVTHIGDLVLDPFLGSGTTMIAAEKAGRRARGIEIDPGYTDLCVRRWELLTGQQATLACSGKTFTETATERESGSHEE